jgi:hypothetical protein
MSTVFEKVADENAALSFTPAEMKRRRPSGKKVYKPHLATKIKWALEDSMERSIAAQRRMRRVLAWLEETRAFEGMDERVLAHLGRLDHELFGLALDVSELERIVTQAVAESRPK